MSKQAIRALRLPLLCLLASCLCVSCFLRGKDAISLPAEDSAFGVERWLVIKDSIVQFRDQSGEAGIITGTARRGEVRQVTGRVVVTKNGQAQLWYQVAEGFLPDTAVITASNRLKAEEIAAGLE